MQTYNDQIKDFVLIQFSTIQRVSQRLIICSVSIFSNNKLYFRDIIQAYMQFSTALNRDFYIKSSTELATIFETAKDCVFKMIKLLYEMFETDNHWFETYHRHHTEKFGMIKLTYDFCLLYRHQFFGIVGFQTDDIFMLASEKFATDEKNAIAKTKFLIKSRNCLTTTETIKFNELKIELHFFNNESFHANIILRQKTHVGEISFIKRSCTSFISTRGVVRENLIIKNQYIAQKTRGAYLTSFCQFEISFDFSHAIQAINISKNYVISLNKRLQWQMKNKTRNLKYVHFDQHFFQIMVFTDAFFANNRDLSSQIGYVICIVNKTNNANFIHWNSIKCKRITRSVLALELYAMAHEFDLRTIIKTTLKKVLCSNIFFIFCTDSKSLYDCFVRLSTIHEKRLMIDVMNLKQSYERRKITKMKWMNEKNNLVDSMIKFRKSSALKTLIDINRISLTISEWMERTAPETAHGNEKNQNV